jgi:HD-like signal output (HDOD) protein
MRRTLTQVRDLLLKSSVNHNRLSGVISRDPGFSLHILQRLNNLPNPPKEPVTKISLAVPLLGMEVIEGASRTLPSLEDRLQGPPRRGLIDCYSRAAHAAIYAREIAGLKGWHEADTLYTAALLYDIGEMALWSATPETMREIQRSMTTGTPRESAARQILGFTLEELSVRLSRQWRLPQLIVDSQGIANSYQPKPLSVMLASAIARESSRGWHRSRTEDDIELLAEFLEMPHETTIARMHGIAAQAARELHRLALPLPAFHLVQSGLEPSAHPATANRHGEAPDPVPRETQSLPPRQGRATPETAAGTQQAPPQKPVNPLQELLNSALHRMHEELGLSRAMFAMLSPDKSALRARFVVEAEKQLSLKGFVLNMTKPSLFKALLNKPQAISLNRNNADKYLPLIPPSAMEQINSSGFVSMSIFIKGKPVGLFYADNGISGPGVTRQQYDNFKVICQKTMHAIGP